VRAAALPRRHECDHDAHGAQTDDDPYSDHEDSPFLIAATQPQRPPWPWRRDGWSRPTFHIWPQASHRQYADASIWTLVVLIFGERQNGHAVGVGAGAAS
jgi:hypothetical protein